jgi:LemA protein
MRSKGAIAILILLILAGLGGCLGCMTNNTLVASEEEVTRAWADVENQYQRRSDLVPRLVEAVDAAAELERDLVSALSRSREEAMGLPAVNPSSSDEMERFMRVQNRLEADLRRLTATLGAAGDLQSVEAYRDLLVQLEGTENRIAVARRRYNEAVSEYNQAVRTAPRSVFASILGFEPKPSFVSDRTDP